MRKAGDDSAKNYLEGGLDRARNFALADYRDSVVDILEGLYSRSLKATAGLVRDSLGKAFPKKRETKEIDETTERLSEIFKAVAFEQVTSIENTMFENLRLITEPLVAEGASTQEIARAIRDETRSLSTWQAARIARTETLMSTAQSQAEIVDELEDLPELAKEWMAVTDSRTRDPHRKMDGTLVKKDGRFSLPNGDRMRYPGDRRGGSKENIINCRCSHSYVPVDDLDASDLERE